MDTTTEATEQVTATPATPSAAVETAASASPAAATLDDFMREATEALAAPAADDTAPDAPEVDDATTEEPDGDSAEPESEAASDDAPTAEFAVEVPIPNADSTLDLTLPTQEAADTLRHHLKQSARVPRLEAKLDSYKQDAATVDFLEQSPTEGMLWMAQRQPEAAAEFVQLFVQQQPEWAVQMLNRLGFQVQATLDPETLNIRAENAALKAQQRVEQGRAQRQSLSVQQQFHDAAVDVVQELAQTLGMTEAHPKYRIYAATAADTVADLYNQNPRATRADIASALAPIVNELRPASAPSVRAAIAAKQPRDEAGRFAEPPKQQVKAQRLEKRNATMRKIAGGATPVMAQGRAPLPPGATLDDIIAGRIK